jgi:hypothetical protein
VLRASGGTNLLKCRQELPVLGIEFPTEFAWFHTPFHTLYGVTWPRMSPVDPFAGHG